jgi:hypothetical protein
MASLDSKGTHSAHPHLKKRQQLKACTMHLSKNDAEVAIVKSSDGGITISTCSALLRALSTILYVC